MRRIHMLFITVLLALMAVPASAGEPFRLFSPEEAQELQLDDAEWEAGARPKSVGLGVGPKIEVKKPLVLETDKGLLIDAPTKLDLLVLFKDGVSAVDMASLNIKARKGWFSKNLTDRLKPYLLGQTILANDIEIPAGRFKLEISIADTGGNESIQEYLCEISDD